MKPVANSAWFKQLSAKRKEQLWHWLNGDPEKEIKALTNAQARAKIRQLWGIKLTHDSRLSNFYSWYGLQCQFQTLDTQRENFEEMLLKKFPQADPKTIQEFGQSYFTMQATARGDAEEFREMEKLRLQKDKERREANRLDLDREHFETEVSEKILKAANDRRIQDIANSSSSNAEKIKRIRQIAFADVDALHASGEVKLPQR